MTLTLAVITGNAEAYFPRFHQSFAPWFDELICVRAIGNQPPDGTLALAESLGWTTAEYHNTAHPDWPHVDDFAAARNVAFDLAHGDFVMWADLDDVLEHGERIRADLEAMPPDCLALSVPYDIRDDGVRIHRERIIRRGAARWVNPIHENLDFPDGVRVAQTDLWQVAHCPQGERRRNDERNLRILESIPQPNGSQRFHTAVSLRAVGRTEDAVRTASALLMDRPEDVGEAELFEMLMMLGQVAPSPDQRANLMLQAVGMCPERREGYGEMALCEMASGRPEKAAAWLTAMSRLPLPDPLPWNTRRKFYGYMEPLLRGMALRMQGYPEEADAIERNAFLRAGARISLLHASRGRPAMAAATRRMWLERAADPDNVEHIFGLDINDPEAMRLTCHRHVWLRGNGGPVDAWNEAARASSGQVLVQLSDDWEPPMHWDRLLIEEIGDLSRPAVLAVGDGHRNDGLLCMAICTRARWQQQGHLFHPEFFSMFSDNWFTECAQRDGVLIDARERLTFHHAHPAFGSGEMDAIYARSNAPWHYRTGAAILERLRAGVRTSAEVEGWFDFRDVYDEMAQHLPAGGRMVEVGTWKGRSAIYLAQRLQDLGTEAELHCVDTFQGDTHTGPADTYAAFLENVAAARVAETIICHPAESAAAAAEFEDGSLDAVFLDGAHDTESVLADLQAWAPKVKPGGILAGHDVDSACVVRALERYGLSPAIRGRSWWVNSYHHGTETPTGPARETQETA